MFVLLRRKPHILGVVDVVAKGRSMFSGLVMCCHPCHKPLKATVSTGVYNNPSEEILCLQHL